MNKDEYAKFRQSKWELVELKTKINENVEKIARKNFFLKIE